VPLCVRWGTRQGVPFFCRVTGASPAQEASRGAVLSAALIRDDLAGHYSTETRLATGYSVVGYSPLFLGKYLNHGLDCALSRVIPGLDQQLCSQSMAEGILDTVVPVELL
jgi:hypothetical protein